MNEGGEGAIPGLAQARERTIEALCEHFAQDALTMPELERRIDLAHRAASRLELARLLEDLPALPAPAGRGVEKPSTAPAWPDLVPPERVRERQVVVAILGGSARRGRWIPPRRLFVCAFCGGAELDFREAQFGPGVTEVVVLALMGGTTILVPPGLAVVSGGVAIMGGFDHVEEAPDPRDPDAPLLRVNGFVMMGGVEIQARLPGETKWEARRRLREERKRLRQERKRLRGDSG